MRYLIIILIAFFISIIIRIPNINRPLSKHHEFVSAHVLRVLTIWKEGGINKYHFAPVMNYEGKENKFINNQSRNFYDFKGDHYYLSYPPFAFILPYLIFNVFNISITPISLQVYNMLLQLIATILIYFIVLKISSNRNAALYTCLIFIFNACSLWFFSNVYFANVLVICFFLSGVYLYLVSQLKYNRLISVLFFLVFFVGCYTEYLMLMLYSAILVHIILFNRSKKGFHIAIIISLATVSSLVLCLYQYSLIYGFDSFIHQAIARYKVRSGYFTDSFIIGIYYQAKTILFNHAVYYGFIVITILVSFIFMLLNKQSIQLDRKTQLLLLLLSIPVLLHNLIFLNASMHDFFVLKTLPFLSVLVSLIFTQAYNNRIQIICVSFLIISSVFLYYYINKPGAYARNGDLYATDKNISQQILNELKSNEVAFTNIDVSPQMVYYTHRNIMPQLDLNQAKLFLKSHQEEKGIMFYFNSTNQLIKIERFKAQ